MAEYIDATKKVTIQVFNDMTEEWHKKKFTIAEVLDKWTDEGCPKPVEAEPVRHGRWIEDEYGIPHCSECKAISNSVFRNYCPNCGARMDEVEE